jgi:hypothetical protein
VRLFLISNFCHVLNVVCFLPGDLPMSEVRMPNVSEHSVHLHRHMKMEQSLMFVLCIIRHSRNNQYNTQICTTALLYILAPTCFGSSLPSSGGFWIRLSYVKIQIDMVVYHIMWLSDLFVGVSWFSLEQSVVKH